MGYSFHQIPVTGNDICVVVDNVISVAVVARGKMLFSHCHADAHCKPLPQRAGGDFNTVGMLEFRMSRGFGFILPEFLQFFHFKCPGRCRRLYTSMEPWPALSTKRSLSNHFTEFGLKFRCRLQRVYAIGAAPMGRPG